MTCSDRADLPLRRCRTPLQPIPRVPGTVSGTSRVRAAFPLVGPLSSTDSATAFTPALFARFTGTMGPSDSLEPYMTGYGKRLPRPSLAGHNRQGRLQGLPVLVHGVSTHAQGLRLRGVQERLALHVAHDIAFPTSGQGRHAEVMISEFNGWPVYTPVNASPMVLPPSAHDSGPGWFAIPFLCGSFIRNSMPVYPGAFPDTFVCIIAAKTRDGTTTGLPISGEL